MKRPSGMKRARHFPPPLVRSSGDNNSNSADERTFLAFKASAEGLHSGKKFPASNGQGEVPID